MRYDRAGNSTGACPLVAWTRSAFCFFASLDLQAVIDAFESRGLDFLMDAFNRCTYLEDLTGLTQMHQETEAALEDGDVAARAAREARERRGRERVEPGARTRLVRRPTIPSPGKRAVSFTVPR